MSSSRKSVKRTPLRQQAEENEPKRKRESTSITSFFKTVVKPPPQKILYSMENSRFKPYVLKENCIMAPIHLRKPLTNDEILKFDEAVTHQNLDRVFLLQSEISKPRKLTLASNMKKDKAKFFQFHDNYRPPYYGTWRYISKFVKKGRKPFTTAESRINYEYDSDVEWEQEPSDAEECDEDADDDDIDDASVDADDGFFVEHGYLSEDEGLEENEQQPVKDETEEQRQQRLAQRAREWEENQLQKERRFKERRVIPNIYLISFDNDPNEYNAKRAFIMPGVLIDYSKKMVRTTATTTTATT